MIPLVISSYPENGSTEVQLSNPLKVEFSTHLDRDTVTTSNIRLDNITQGTSVALSIIYDEVSNEITITPQDNAYGNMLLGSSTYKLSLSNLQSFDGDLLTATYTLDFNTVSDNIEDVLQAPDTLDEFEITNFYPRQGSYNSTPEAVKIKCNKSIDELTVTASTFIVTSDPIEDMSDIGFITISTVPGTYSVVGPIATFTPTEPLDDNTKYTVVILGVKSSSGDNLEPITYTFLTEFTPSYVTLEEVKTASISSIIRNILPQDIYALIKSNSDMAKFIADQAGNTDIDWESVPKYVKEYVTAKTRYDIVFDRYIQIASEASSKTLSDLTIEYGFSIADLLALADRLKLQYLYWENMLKGSTTGKSGPAAFRKGENIDEDPDFMNRRLKGWDGNKSW